MTIPRCSSTPRWVTLQVGASQLRTSLPGNLRGRVSRISRQLSKLPVSLSWCRPRLRTSSSVSPLGKRGTRVRRKSWILLRWSWAQTAMATVFIGTRAHPNGGSCSTMAAARPVTLSERSSRALPSALSPLLRSGGVAPTLPAAESGTHVEVAYCVPDTTGNHTNRGSCEEDEWTVEHESILRDHGGR